MGDIDGATQLGTTSSTMSVISDRGGDPIVLKLAVLRIAGMLELCPMKEDVSLNLCALLSSDVTVWSSVFEVCASLQCLKEEDHLAADHTEVVTLAEVLLV